MPDPTPEPLLKKADANAKTIEIDVKNIREAIKQLLAFPEVAEFINKLLKLAAEVSEKPGNTLVENGDVLKVYDIINPVPPDSSVPPGMFRGTGNRAHGCIALGNARIELGHTSSGADITMTDLKKLWLRFDVPLALHETIHHAGRLCYSDKDLARAMCKLLNLDIDKELPTAAERTIDGYSNFWHQKLMEVCKPKLKKILR